MDGGGFGRFERHLLAGGHDLSIVQAWRGAAIPDPEGCDAILIGGSPLAAYDWRHYAFLREEATVIQRADVARTPILGICFGAQFLAHLLGGRAYRAGRSEIGVHTVYLTDEGRSDPLLAGFPPSLPVLQWHGDTFDLPPGAALLAKGDGIRHQLFRRGHVVGVQFHPEVTDGEVARWAEANPGDVTAAGKSRDSLVEEYRAIESQLDHLGVRLLDNFLATVQRGRTDSAVRGS